MLGPKGPSCGIRQADKDMFQEWGAGFSLEAWRVQRELVLDDAPQVWGKQSSVKDLQAGKLRRSRTLDGVHLVKMLHPSSFQDQLSSQVQICNWPDSGITLEMLQAT